MEIKSAEFIISNTDYLKCPDSRLPEYAFIGRSNVGKSSLINMLCNRKDLAMTSSKPGKTLLINHFLINESWYIVDLPGYGFSKTNKKTQGNIYRMITDYILKREQLVCMFVLVDSRHKAQQIDLDFLEFLGENDIPFAIVFTKTDKSTQTEVEYTVREYKETLLMTWEKLPPIFMTSSEKGRGRKEILQYIADINTSLTSMKTE